MRIWNLDAEILKVWDGDKPESPWADSNHACYLLIEKMGRMGFSCFLNIMRPRQIRGRYNPGRIFCRFESVSGIRAGAQVTGCEGASQRRAICLAFLEAIQLIERSPKSTHAPGRNIKDPHTDWHGYVEELKDIPLIVE